MTLGEKEEDLSRRTDNRAEKETGPSSTRKSFSQTVPQDEEAKRMLICARKAPCARTPEPETTRGPTSNHQSSLSGGGENRIEEVNRQRRREAEATAKERRG